MQSKSILPRWAFVMLAVITAAIGLSASWVTAQFFILGLERLEPDPMARGILVFAGILMIVTELAAFGISALLPKARFRSERNKLIATGLILLAFEAITICVTQGSLDKASESAAKASVVRGDELKASIDARRAAANSLRSNGTTQSASSNAWTRTLGAAAIRDALKVEVQIEPLATELAQLQAAARPTTASVLGEQGTMLYGIAKGLLISGMGLVMFGVAGSLLAKGLGIDVVPTEQTAPEMAKQTILTSVSKTKPQTVQSPSVTATGARPNVVLRGWEWCQRRLQMSSSHAATSFPCKAAA